MLRRLILTLALILTPLSLAAADFTFDSIDGGKIRLSDLRGGPVLIVNTASQCAFTKQYDGLQELYDRYRAQGLTVLAVPSDDFRQELANGEQVKEFCAINFDLTLPMTDITPVRGGDAHPFYRWLLASEGVKPKWNFSKVLLDADGAFVANFGSMVRPTAPKLTRAIEAELQR